MHIEAIKRELTPYMDRERSQELLFAAMDYLSEEVSAVIPSLVISNDGVRLHGLVLLTDNFLCDIRVQPNRRHDYDYLRKDTVFNLRFELGYHQLVQEEKVVDTYEIATVQLIHFFANMRTELHYAGHERDTWINKVRREFPLEALRRQP